ncbi:hypothetical protein YC2023_007436 [Brassica napus]
MILVAEELSRGDEALLRGSLWASTLEIECVVIVNCTYAVSRLVTTIKCLEYLVVIKVLETGRVTVRTGRTVNPEKTTNYLRRPTTGEDEDHDIVNRRWD